MNLIPFLLALMFAAWLNLALVQDAKSWELDDLNRHVDHTNFIVNEGCSGTLVSLEDRYILTANHCLDNLTTFIEEDELQDDGTVKKVKKYYRKPLEVKQSVLDDNGNITGTVVHRANIVGTDIKYDLAMVQVIGELENAVEAKILPDDETITRGEVAWIIGNPLGLENTVNRGIISALKREIPGFSGSDNSIKYTQFDGGSIGGNSGGGLFNDQGELIGVVVIAHRTASHLAFAVDIDEVRNFVANPKRTIASSDESDGTFPPHM